MADASGHAQYSCLARLWPKPSGSCCTGSGLPLLLPLALGHNNRPHDLEHLPALQYITLPKSESLVWIHSMTTRPSELASLEVVNVMFDLMMLSKTLLTAGKPSWTERSCVNFRPIRNIYTAISLPYAIQITEQRAVLDDIM